MKKLKIVKDKLRQVSQTHPNISRMWSIYIKIIEEKLYKQIDECMDVLSRVDECNDMTQNEIFLLTWLGTTRDN